MKNSDRMRLFTILGLLALLLSMWSCAPKATQKTLVVANPDEPIATDAGEIVVVQAATENVRSRPNGRIIGKVRKSESLTVVKRIGNWVYFNSNRFPLGCVWGPSVGYDYFNLYNPEIYYDRFRKQFYDTDYFRRLFSQEGEIRQDFTSSYELFFGDIGLGSHETQIVDIAETTEQLVAHGVTLFVKRSPDRVYKVKVDYFRAKEGYQNALEKSELPVKPPTLTNKGHVIWSVGSLITGLTVDLERSQWLSDRFSSIWFMLPGEK